MCIRDSLGAVQHGGLALVAVDRPAGCQRAQRAAGHLQDAQGVVVHADKVAVGVALVQRDDLGGGLDDLLVQQVLDQIDLCLLYTSSPRAERRRGELCQRYWRDDTAADI